MAPKPSLSDIASFQELASSDGTNCMWYLINHGRRCNNTVNQADRVTALELGALILRCSPGQVQLEQLKEYARLKCCKQARHRLVLKDCGLLEPLAQRWLSELSERRTSPSGAQSTAYAARTLRIPREPDIQSLPGPRVIATRSRTQQASANTTTVLEETSSTNISSSPFRPRIVRSYQNVSSKLRDPLTATSETGTIYLFTRESSLDHVKIGFTKWPAQCRLDQWEKNCGYKPIPRAAFSDVPHMQKVEQLIHHQLAAAWRVEKWCVRCSQQHREWFEIRSEEAVAVAGQWVQWMRSAKPYDTDGHLRDIWLDELRGLEAKGISVTAEILLATHLRSLHTEPTILHAATVDEDEEVSETPTDVESVEDIEVSTNILFDPPFFADIFTAEPDTYSSRSHSQTSAISTSHISILTNYLSTMFMIVRVLVQLSPDVLRLLGDSSAMSSSTRQSSMMS